MFVAKLKAGPILQTKGFSSRRSNSTSCHGNIYILIHSSAGAAGASSRRWRRWHGTCGNWNVCLVLFAASQAAKAGLKNMSVSQWSCVFTWASSRVAFSWTGDRGRHCRLHASSDCDDCLHAYFCDSGARLDAPCGFYDRVCYPQKYTHRQQLARLEESARGDTEGDRHHQWAAGNSPGEGLWAQLQRTWRKSPIVHAKQWLQSLTGCLCKTHSESSSQDRQQTLSFLPTRDKEGQRQSPKALELSGDSCIEACSTLPLERRMNGCYWRSISTCPYLIWLSKK